MSGPHFERDQGICAGLLVRITKFMLAIVQLVATARAKRREVVLALSRCVMESAVNCGFLATSSDPTIFQRFVTTGLGPERELYDEIRANIQKRGGKVLPIETRMLEAIDGLSRASGVRIEDVSSKHQEWGGSFRDKLKA
jgi:hypothetical protein